jgi:hypothetical protein
MVQNRKAFETRPFTTRAQLEHDTAHHGSLLLLFDAYQKYLSRLVIGRASCPIAEISTGSVSLRP